MLPTPAVRYGQKSDILLRSHYRTDVAIVLHVSDLMS